MNYRRVCQMMMAPAAGAVAVMAGAPAFGQWSCDPSSALVVGDGSNEQVQAKIIATSDGGAYVSWFDNSASGYDVRLQRLDAGGVEQWPHNGVLVADRSYSSTQDYGLAVDADDHAVLAFRHDVSGVDRISAQRVSPAGDLLWGPDGIQFGGDFVFVASPKIAATGNGEYVVAWINGEDVQLERLDAAGNPVWTPGVTISEVGASLSLCDLRGSDNGGVIVSWIRSESFFSPRHLYTQKLDADGGLLWGADHVAAFDGGTLQFGNFPPFVTDGAGGAVFSWYSTDSGLQCYAQRILADGTEAFGHNGVPVSTAATRQRVSPRVAFNPVTEETFVFWTEESLNQAQRGVYGQKLDAAGGRQWGSEGVAVVAVHDADYLVQTGLAGDGAVVAYIEMLGFSDARVKAARYDSAGDAVWTPVIREVASTSTEKSRLAIAAGNSSLLMMSWQDGGTGAADLLAQNLNDDGSLGYAPLRLEMRGSCPGAILFGVTNATPLGPVAFLWSRSRGVGSVPPGTPCAGACLYLGEPVQIGAIAAADSRGLAVVRANIPAAACERLFVQAVDVTSCQPSRARTVE